MATILFDEQTLYYFSHRITPEEAEQVTQWARIHLEKQINQCAVDKQHMMNIVAHKSLLALQILLRASEGSSTAKDLRGQTLFVQYYSSYLRTTRKLALIDLQNKDEQAERLAARHNKFIVKIQQKILKRDAKRQAYLQQALSITDGQPIRFQMLADWYCAEKLQQLDFDLIVLTFVEHITQRLMEKSIKHLIFPLLNTNKR